MRGVKGAKCLGNTKTAKVHECAQMPWVPSVILKIQRCMHVCMHGGYQLGRWLLSSKLTVGVFVRDIAQKLIVGLFVRDIIPTIKRQLRGNVGLQG